MKLMQRLDRRQAVTVIRKIPDDGRDDLTDLVGAMRKIFQQVAFISLLDGRGNIDVTDQAADGKVALLSRCTFHRPTIFRGSEAGRTGRDIFKDFEELAVKGQEPYLIVYCQIVATVGKIGHGHG